MDFESKGFLGVEIDSLMEPIITSYSEWFSVFEKVNEFSNQLKENIQVNTHEKLEITLMMLFIKLSNHYQSIFFLVRKGLTVESDILLRSMFETLLPLKLLVMDEDFLDEFIISDKANKLSLFNVVLDKSNAGIFAVDESDAIKRKLLKEELEVHFKDGKIRSLKVEELAKRADMGTDYQLLYRFLSGHAHSSLDILEKSYLIINDKSEIEAFNIGFYDEPIKRILFSSMHFMIMSSGFMNNHFKMAQDLQIQSYIDLLLEVRKMSE